MKVENIQSQMRKGVLEYCILSIIKNGEVYPGDILEEVKNAGLDLLEGTLYPLLNRLKNADMLSYRWVESTTGPPRKYFSLTDKGLVFYNLLESTWNDLNGSVEKLVNKANEVENENEEDIATVS
jgi:PadR family transcriptional regulator PadR